MHQSSLRAHHLTRPRSHCYCRPRFSTAAGKIVNKDDGIGMRDRYYKAAYEVAEEYAKEDGILQGTLFWCVRQLPIYALDTLPASLKPRAFLLLLTFF